jgi:hypothetical protein
LPRGGPFLFFTPRKYRHGGWKLAQAEFIQRGLSFAVLHATEVGKPVYAGLGWAATAEMAKGLNTGL